MKVKKIALVSILAALAVVLGWVENALPLSFSVPGIKLGLANIAVVTALCMLGRKEAAAVAFLKVALSSLLFSGLSGFMYAFAGAFLSLAVMVLLCSTERFSLIGVSAAGGFCHVAAQFAVAMVITSTPELWRTAPLPLMCGVISGALNGWLAVLLTGKLEKIRFEGR